MYAPCPDGLRDVVAVVVDCAPLPILVCVIGEHVIVHERVLFQGRQLLSRKVCEEERSRMGKPEPAKFFGRPGGGHRVSEEMQARSRRS